MKRKIAQITIYDDHHLIMSTNFEFDSQYFNRDKKLGQQIIENTFKFFQSELIKNGLAKQDQYHITQ